MCWLGCTASAEGTAHGSTGAEHILSQIIIQTNIVQIIIWTNIVQIIFWTNIVQIIISGSFPVAVQ